MVAHASASTTAPDVPASMSPGRHAQQRSRNGGPATAGLAGIAAAASIVMVMPIPVAFIALLRRACSYVKNFAFVNPKLLGCGFGVGRRAAALAWEGTRGKIAGYFTAVPPPTPKRWQATALQ